jgi:curved DNA-binding protein CbpA
MTDYFALLNEPRRPWLDSTTLKAKFLALSAQTHPDRVNAADPAEKETVNRRFAELNAAYNCLREPRTRLLHLLELELGAKPKDLQQIPTDLADVFVDIARLCRETDEFLIRKAKTSSPLLQAQLFERGQEWTEQLLARQQDVARRQDKLLAVLLVADQMWSETPAGSPARAGLLEQLQEIWRLLSFLNRWTSQIQERITRLIL